MGQAKRKRDIAAGKVPLDKTIKHKAELLARNAPTEITLDKFNRDLYDCAPETAIVRRDAEQVLAKGQIAIGKAERQQTGVVEISGYDWLKPGDKVLFSKFGGTDIMLDDTKLVHLHRLQIYARKRAAA
jgi:co-chaperonin GroES (HSP10)